MFGSNNRGTFVPKRTGDNGVSNCRTGPTQTIGIPPYVLTVRNPEGTLPAECFFVLEDEVFDGNLVPIQEDNGELLCVDDI